MFVTRTQDLVCRNLKIEGFDFQEQIKDKIYCINSVTLQCMIVDSDGSCTVPRGEQ
jgi:hypothetical protein